MKFIFCSLLLLFVTIECRKEVLIVLPIQSRGNRNRLKDAIFSKFKEDMQSSEVYNFNDKRTVRKAFHSVPELYDSLKTKEEQEETKKIIKEALIEALSQQKQEKYDKPAYGRLKRRKNPNVDFKVIEAVAKANKEVKRLADIVHALKENSNAILSVSTL